MEHPLANLCFLNTRPKEQAAELSALLEKQGGTTFEFPTIEILPDPSWPLVRKHVAALSSDDWIIFTSANAVREIAKQLQQERSLTSSFPRAHVAAIGKQTARVAKGLGFPVGFTAQKATSETFANEFLSFLQDQFHSPTNNRTLLLLRGEIADENLPKLLVSDGVTVITQTVYQNKISLPNKEHLKTLIQILQNSRKGFDKDGIGRTAQTPGSVSRLDMLLFTSSEAARNFLRILEKEKTGKTEDVLASVRAIPAAVIGPKTAKTVEDLGFTLVSVANEASINSLVEGIVEYWSQATQGEKTTG